MANGCVMCGKTRFNFGDYDEGVEMRIDEMDCGWDGRIWEYIGFGDMLAYEAVHCPKCGAIIKRCA